MEEPNKLVKIGIGTKDKETLKPSVVKIASVIIQTTKKNGEELKTPLANVKVKHPDKEELITLTKMTYIKDKKVVVAGLWVQLDEDELIQKSSTIDVLLTHLGCKTLEEMYGKDIETVVESETSKFLCLKAY